MKISKLVVAFLEIKGRIHYALLVLHEESIYSQMREQVARYALAHIGGAESVRQCLWGDRVRTNAQIWENDTNITGGLGHVLPRLASTYGRTAAGAPRGWSRPAQSPYGTTTARTV